MALQESYYLLKEDGTMSEEIIGTPPVMGIFGDAYECTTISVLKDHLFRDAPQGELVDFLKENKSGIYVTMIFSDYRPGSINAWMKDRGMGVYFGPVILAATTDMVTDNVFLPIQAAVDISNWAVENEAQQKIHETYYIIHEDGTISDEICMYPPIDEMFGDYYECKVICALSEETIRNAPQGEVVDWAKGLGKGISLNIIMCELGSGRENSWLKERGLCGIYGHVILTGSTVFDESSDSCFLPTKATIDVAESILGEGDKTILDCMVHANRRQDYHHRTDIEKRATDKTKIAPDDTQEVFFEKTCAMCDKSADAETTISACQCYRVYYCSEECQKRDWKKHNSFLHKGVFL